MKTFVSFCFLFSIYLANGQEIVDKETFKKCRKEFSKKICLSDEDGDGVLFYLDRCAKESGVVENNGCRWPDFDGDGVLDKNDACLSVAGPEENNGCPWPDTDEDGILDKDDACPTIPGIPENNGCKGRDCSDVIKREQERLKKLQEEAKEINYNTLSDRIIKDIDFTLLKEKNIIYLVDYELLVCGTGLESSCGGYYEATPIYKNSDFWTEETIMKIFNKTKKNFILGMLYGGMGSGIEFENIPKDISNLNFQNKKIKISKQGSEKEVSIYYKNNITQPIKKLNVLSVNISKNDFEKKVNVEMLYTTYHSDISLLYNIHNYKRKYLIYQFINNQWELIETKQNF